MTARQVLGCDIFLAESCWTALGPCWKWPRVFLKSSDNYYWLSQSLETPPSSQRLKALQGLQAAMKSKSLRMCQRISHHQLLCICLSRGEQDPGVKMVPSWQSTVSHGDLIGCRPTLLLAFGTGCRRTGGMDRDCHSPLPLARGCSNPSTAVSKLICPHSPLQAGNESYSGKYCKNAALMWKLRCLFWGRFSPHHCW